MYFLLLQISSGVTNLFVLKNIRTLRWAGSAKHSRKSRKQTADHVLPILTTSVLYFSQANVVFLFSLYLHVHSFIQMLKTSKKKQKTKPKKKTK